jgi:hypothetical protein
VTERYASLKRLGDIAGPFCFHRSAAQIVVATCCVVFPRHDARMRGATAVAESSRTDSNIAIPPICAGQDQLSTSNARSGDRATLPIRSEKNLNAERLTGHGHGWALNLRPLRHTSLVLIANSSNELRAPFPTVA